MQIPFVTLGWANQVDAASIMAHDPSFSLDEFVSFAQAVFLRVNRARAAGQLADVRRMLADGIFDELQAEGAAASRADVGVDRADVVGAGRDGAWDTVTVRFQARATVGRAAQPFTEDWTFNRAATAQGSVTESECPVCGAPLSVTDQGTCRYCNAPISGGTSGWRLVRIAAVAAPAVEQTVEQALAPLQASSRRKWVVIVPVAIVVLTVIGGPLADYLHSRSSDTAAGTSSATFKGQVNLTGAITGTGDGDVELLGAGFTGCRDVRETTGMSFTSQDTSDGGKKTLDVLADLPPGVQGPGTYDLSKTSLDLNAHYSFRPSQGSSATAEDQSWGVQSGKTTAVLVVKTDGSGRLTITGLAPEFPQAEGDSLGDPLNVDLSISCH